MVTRIYEGDKNETGGTGIEVTDNKVINLILRSLNNLIKVNDNNEVYTDLQLDDGIENTDALPIGVNVGRVLAADGRPVTGTLISGQTTSGDWVKVLYGDNGNIYMDNGTGVWSMLGINTTTFFLQNTSDLVTAQAIYDWYAAGKEPIIRYGGKTFIMMSDDSPYLEFSVVNPGIGHGSYASYITQERIMFTISSNTVTNISVQTENTTPGGGEAFLSPAYDYPNPITPLYDGSPATKKYVDDKVIIDSNTPATPSVGQFRYDTTSSTLNLYDGNQRVTI